MDMDKWIISLTYILVTLLFPAEAVDVQVVVGKTATLPCSISFSGNPLIIWSDPQNQLLSRGTTMVTPDRRFRVTNPYQRLWNLVIENVKTTDAGEYTCNIQTNPPQAKKVTLQVQVGPTIDRSSPAATLNVGQDWTFECTARGWPTPVISWYRYAYNGERQSLDLTGQYLSLKNVSRHDAAMYECEANNGVPPIAKASMKLDINFAPEITIPYSQISQQEGKDTLLECLVTANPHFSLYWAKDSKRLANSSKYYIQTWDVGQYTKTLSAFVYDLVESDYGEYACVASNAYGKDVDSINLYEWHTGHIKVLHTPEDAIAQHTKGVLLNCTVEGMSHRDTLTWWRAIPGSPNQKLFTSYSSSQTNPVYLDSDKYEIRGHYNLYIKHATVEDAGLYLCEVTGHKNFTAHLTVVEEVQCENKNVNGTVIDEGNPAILECGLQFAGPPPIWEVDWAVRDTKLSSVNLDDIGALLRRVAFPAYLKDTGIYTCTVSSSSPKFSGSCTTELDVKKVNPTASPICSGKAAHMSTALVITVTVACGIFIILLVAMCYTIIHYKRELKKYKETEARSSIPPQHNLVEPREPSVGYKGVEKNGTKRETSFLMPSRKDLMMSSPSEEPASAPVLPTRDPRISSLSDYQETSSLLKKERRPAVEPPQKAPPPPTSPPPEEEVPLAMEEKVDLSDSHA